MKFWLSDNQYDKLINVLKKLFNKQKTKYI